MKENIIRIVKDSKLKIFSVIFGLVFLVSLFTSISVLAQTPAFVIESANIIDKSSTVSGNITNYDDDEIENNITFHKVNDYAVFDLSIKNNLSKDITILSITDDNSNEYVTYDYAKHENEKLSSGKLFNLAIKVTYSKEVNNLANRSQDNRVSFTIKYLENGEVKGDTIVINPNTNDNVRLSYILMFISIIGLITCLLLENRNKISKTKTFIIIAILLCPVVVKAATFAYNITFKTSIELFDKLIVTYSVEGVENTIECNYGDVISLTEPSKEGYSFAGWTYSDGSVFDPTKSVTSDAVIEANFDLINYAIDYDLDGGTATPENPTTYTIVTPTFTLTNPEKTGYTFTGWSGTDLTGDDNTEVIISEGSKKDLSYKANYTANNYQVTFNANSTGVTGTMTDIDLTYDVATILPTTNYAKEGYTFAGWNTKADGSGTHYDDGEEVVNLSAINNDTVSLYAEWNANTYTIIFDSNAPAGHPATGSMSALAMVYDIDSDLPANSYSVEGYTFVNWNTKADGSGDPINNEATVINLATSGSITLYAQYSLITYVITFDVNGGNENNTVVVVNYGEAIGSLPVVTKDGSIFTGWYTDADNGDQVDEYYIPTDDKILYAHYEPLLCRKATTLHSIVCGTGGSCINVGHTIGDRIAMGSISYENLEAGNAFDCDVNGDGTYDPDTERFYYLRTLANDNAVLISHTNYEGSAGQVAENYFNYGTALTMLPTNNANQWKNVKVTFTNEYDSTDTNTYAARFATIDDLLTATGQASLTAVGSMNDYPYLMENTRFVSSTTAHSGFWLMMDNNKYYRIHTGPSNRNLMNVQSTSNNVARPVIEVPMEYLETKKLNVVKSTLTFITDGGSDISPIKVENYAALGTLPTPTKNGHTFKGWYYDSALTTSVKTTDFIEEDTTIYAKWELTSVARIGDTYYDTVSLALDEVNQDGLTIVLLKNKTENITIPAGMNVTIDLNGYDLNSTASTNSTITVAGNLHLINGSVTSASTKAAAINIDPDGVLLVEDVDVTMTGARQVLYNKAGTATIKGDSHFVNKGSARATVHTLENGTTNLLEGTFISEKLYAIYNESGTLNIGSKDNVFDTSTPIIQGKTYGVIANSKFNFYDGIIKGGTSHIGTATTGTNPTVAVDTNESKINEYEDNCTKEKHPEDIDGVIYQTFYCSLDNSKLRIRFDANGGEVATTSKIINDGDPIGELPVPTNGIYTFVGWFTAKTGGTMINENTVPTTSGTYYAHWSYSSSDEIVNFNMDNDAMNVYYSSISTWTSDQDTFQTNMDANFNNYNCSSCTGPNYQSCPAPEAGKTLCDQPKGYNTGVPNIKVYISDENTKVKGDEVAYVTITDGIIYNMIPGQTYYWEATDDSNVYGYVKANGTRRTISSNVRNVRDLGGLEVDVDNDGTVDGTIKYGKLFRGPKLSTNNSDVLELKKLGITEELDLRGSSSEAKFDNYVGRSITNYLIYPDTYPANYATFRQALKDTMQDVVSGENIYFHCAIGTDRTGTMAFFLEGLLGVSHEDKLEDYDLSYFYGLLNRHRLHDNLSGSSINPRFKTMANTYNTNQLIYEYFIAGAANETEKEADKQLVRDFRAAMIDYNS